MRRRTVHRRGIAIIISLIMMVLVTMFVTAMFIMLPTSVESARNSAEGKIALAAAQSGVEYAWCRLQERPTWKGDGNGNSSVITINTPKLVITEDHGNVWGFISDAQGRSQFRIRFNWHDGSAGGDGLSDPIASLKIPSQYISFNNLEQSRPAPVLRGTPDSTAPLSSTSPHSYQVAQYSCCLLVEGLAGTGLRDTSPSSPLPSARAGRVVKQILEVDLGRPTLASLDSAIYGSSIKADTPGQVLDVQSQGAAAARLRTLSTVKPTQYKTGPGGSVVASTNPHPTIPSVGPAPLILYESKQSQQKKWLAVKKSDIPQASSTVDPQLPAGTYVWRRGGNLDYYAQNYSGVLPSGPPNRTIHGDAEMSALMGTSETPINVDPTTYTLQYNKNVYVRPQGPVSSLTILPEPDIATLEQNRPKNVFQGARGSSPVLTGTSDITLQGSLLGKGSVTSGGNIKFQGTSVFESDQGKNVAVYAAQNVTLEAIPAAVASNLEPSNAASQGSHSSLYYYGHSSYNYYSNWRGGGHSYWWDYGGGHSTGHDTTSEVNGSSSSFPNRLGNLSGNDVSVTGLIYAGGNFTTNLNAGTIYLRGALVAFGGDADAGELAGTRGGDITLNSKGAQFVFDPTYVVSSMSLSQPTRLVLSLQNRY